MNLRMCGTTRTAVLSYDNRGRKHRLRCIAAVVATLIFGCLAGCAALDKCGLRGCPGDADITAEVRALYTQYPALEATNSIDIQTVDRIVYLRGVVDTPFQRRFAEEVALEAKGVSRVENLLGLSNSR